MSDESIKIQIVCPLGDHNDMIQKVSAIIIGQTYHVQGTTTQTQVYTDSEGKIRSYTEDVPLKQTRRSILAEQLNCLPEEPKLKPPQDFISGLIIVSYLWIVPFVAFGVIGMCGLPVYVISDAPDTTFFTRILGGLLFAAIEIAGIAYVFFTWRFLKRRSENETLKQKPEFESRLNKWRKAKNKWEQSYYCHRHDIVFVPENSDSAPTSSFLAFLERE
jgi:hypothetical protein